MLENCALLDLKNQIINQLEVSLHDNCRSGIRLFRNVSCLLQQSFVRWWVSHKRRVNKELKASLSRIVLLLCTSLANWQCSWAQKKKKGGLPRRISLQEFKYMYYLPLNLTSSGEKVALTQAVERHLPTYASLALDSRKSGSEKLARTRIEWKCIMWKYKTTFVCADVSIAMRGNYVDVVENPLQSLFWYFWKPLRGYQVVQLQVFRPPSRDGGSWERFYNPVV